MGHTNLVYAISWSDSGLASLSASPEDNEVIIWNTNNWIIYKKIPVINRTYSLEWVPNNPILTMAGQQSDGLPTNVDPFIASFSGFVWADGNRDGLQAGEENNGISDITLNLYDETETLVSSTTTAPDSSYSLEAEPDNTYTLELVAPPNRHFSPAHVGSDDTLDSDFDPVTGRSEAITVGVAQQVDLDAGLLPLGYLPYHEDFESGASHWLTQNGWAVSDEAAYAGSFAMSDSPGTDYTLNNNAVLELAHPLYLTNAVYPVQLSYWTRYAFNVYDEGYQYAYVEVSTDEGATWETLDNEFPRDDPNNVLNQQLEWFQQSLDLTPYLGQVIRLRFRLFVDKFSQPADGWWIDEVEITN